MKRLITVIILLCLLSVSASAAVLQQSAATSVGVWFYDPATGLGKTGLTVTSIGCEIMKSDGTAAFFNPTASGGSNDMVEKAHGLYYLELTATQLNTVGWFELGCEISGSTSPSTVFDVLAPAAYSSSPTGNIASIADFWAQATSGMSTVGSIGKLAVDNLDLPVSTIATTLGTPIAADLATDISNIYSRQGAPAGASQSADIATIQADTDDLQSRVPAALSSGRMDASVGAYQTGLTPLQPTVDLRKLDVTATGAGGIDLGNVENPTTTLNLSGTTIKTATDVEAKVADVTTGTATNGTANTITLAVGDSALNNGHAWALIRLISGTGAGQTAQIQSFNSTTKVATIFCQQTTTGNWITNPGNGTGYVIITSKR